MNDELKNYIVKAREQNMSDDSIRANAVQTEKKT